MSNIKINTQSYRNAYSKAPRGYGFWIFEIHTADAIEHVAHTGNYGNAARAAIAEARTHGAAFRSIILGA